MLTRQQPDLNTTRYSDFCAGTNSTGDTTVYVCGDYDLGPVTLPLALPLNGVVGADSTYQRFGGACPGQILAQWTEATTGQFNYPPFAGYMLTTDGTPATFNITLTTGIVLDRFGSEYGSYMSPAGTPYAQRSLPPTNLDATPGSLYPYNYHLYMVSRPINVQSGPIAGWFGQQGLGLQSLMPMAVRDLLSAGYLTALNTTSNPLK